MAAELNACVLYASFSLPTPGMTTSKTALLRLCDVVEFLTMAKATDD
jgi:hypothetical protein